MVETLTDKYYKHFLTYELIISLLISGLAIAIIQFILSPEEVYKWMFFNKSQFYSLLATISGTLLGFIITGISVIMSLSESKKLEPATESTQFKKIFLVYFSTIKFLAFTAIVSIIGFLVNSNFINMCLFYLLIILSIVSVFRIYRSVWVLKKIVDIIIPDADGNSIT